jgi:hypothetical protein
MKDADLRDRRKAARWAEKRRDFCITGKTCPRCKKHLPAAAYSRSNKEELGAIYICKSCDAEAKRKHHAYCMSNDADKVRERARKKYRRKAERRPDYYREKNRRRYARETGDQKAIRNLRKKLRETIKAAQHKSSERFDGLCGCSPEDLRRHLEAKFSPAMTWDNYGTYWHVDHVRPISSFNHADPRDVSVCWHYTNLQPLEAFANLSKGSKFVV